MGAYKRSHTERERRKVTMNNITTNPYDHDHWGHSDDGNTNVPPEIMCKIIRPDLFGREFNYVQEFEREYKIASNEIPQRNFSKTFVIGVIEENDRRGGDARSMISSGIGPDSLACCFGLYEFEANPATGVELGDTLLHVAARACNAAAIRACVTNEPPFSLAFKNKAGKYPYECIPEDHPLAEEARAQFPAEWISSFEATKSTPVNPVLAAKRAKKLANQAAEDVARQQTFERAEARKAQQLEKAAAAQQERRNAQMRQVAREKAMAKAAGEQARRQEEVAKSNTGLSRPAYHRRR